MEVSLLRNENSDLFTINVHQPPQRDRNTSLSPQSVSTGRCFPAAVICKCLELLVMLLLHTYLCRSTRMFLQQFQVSSLGLRSKPGLGRSSICTACCHFATWYQSTSCRAPGFGRFAAWPCAMWVSGKWLSDRLKRCGWT